MNRDDRFTQPVEAIKIVSRSKGPDTLLTDEELLNAKARIAAGEDADAVYAELAQLELEREVE